jgi:two-component system, response regulator PdtaR
MDNQSPPPADQPEARVLLADDSTVERQALAHLLRQAGYRVDEADDGEATILFLKQWLPDILLLDLQMPGTDGFGVLSYIQKNKQDFPVILLSGLPPDQIQKAIKRLPSPFLPPLLIKPVDPTQLLNIVALRLTGELPT